MIRTRKLAPFFCLLLIAELLPACAQDYYEDHRANWLALAEQAIPSLKVEERRPEQVVSLAADQAAFQGWKAERIAASDVFFKEGFKQQSGIVLDFGNHYTGQVAFRLDPLDRASDAPTRLKFTFGEVPSELATPFDPYPGGLSRAWLQDEIVTVSALPAEIVIPRRLAFRYVKIELLSPSQAYDFRFNDLYVEATTSATGSVDLLPANTPKSIQEIDRIGMHTLRECMQTVYEDGPKRDRRLWIGDLYLEALANNYSFKNHELTKRCLYLLAALSDSTGNLHGTVFERPYPHPQDGQHLLDYSLLYNVALKDYLTYSGDSATVQDLWIVAKRQVELARRYLTSTPLIDFKKASEEQWIFIDWKDGLDREAAINGLALFAFRQTYELAKQLNKTHEVADLPTLIDQLSKALYRQYYDEGSGLFISGKDGQVSYASQIWMILGGVVDQKKAAKILRTLTDKRDALKPGGPYLYHYYVQALIDAGMYAAARETLLDYWGAMVKKGADTFWEVYDPADEFLSPYGFFPINSYCHAWSCTPVYFIRKYPEVFQ